MLVLVQDRRDRLTSYHDRDSPVETSREPLFMNAANKIEHFTIMRIREEQNLNVIFVEHFVRIELEHFLSICNARS